MSRAQHLTAADKAALAALWREHPHVSGAELTRIATARLGRPCAPSTVRDHRPPGCGKRRLACCPRPVRGVTAVEIGDGPLAHLITEARKVWRRVRPARSREVDAAVRECLEQPSLFGGENRA